TFRDTCATSRSDRSRRCDVAFAAIEKVAVERQDYVGPFNSRNEAQIVAETDLRGKILRFTPQRIVNTPAQAWEHFFQLAANSFTRGRMCFFNEKGQPCAVPDFPAQIVQIFFKIGDALGLAIFCDPFCAQWIVKLVDRSLDENIAGAVAHRMQRIAIEFDGTAIDGGNQERDGAVSPRHRRAVVEKFSGNGPFHRFCERNKVEFRAATTTDSKSGERNGRAHELQKVSTTPFISV